MKYLFVFCFYLALISGVAGLLAVLLDIFLFRDYIFNTYEIAQFVTLTSFALLIKKFILPHFNNKKAV
jgi:hypothetical protein